jgi:Stage II sporulation protein E (SpoIIE)
MTNAGHPPALWYRTNRDEWTWFEPTRAGDGAGVRGTPLGLLPNVSYDRMIVKPDPGDLIVLYSDGVSEATGPIGTELGRDRLMTTIPPCLSADLKTVAQRHHHVEDHEVPPFTSQLPKRVFAIVGNLGEEFNTLNRGHHIRRRIVDSHTASTTTNHQVIRRQRLFELT